MSRSRRFHLTLGISVLLTLGAACSSGAPAAPSEPGNQAEQVAITAQPQDQTIAPGNSATLSVTASGGGAMAYQWFIGTAGQTGTPVNGATTSSYATPALSATTRYWVRVSTGGSAADSVTATVSVHAGAPFVTAQPRNETIEAGETARLGVEAEGMGPLTYQWFRGTAGSTSDPMAGATSSKYTTATLNETTRYWVRVSNSIGAVNSATSTVTVVPGGSAPPAPTPSPGPPSNPAAPFEDELLARVNQHRAGGATCGGIWFPPVGALSMNANLRTAARGHSEDMATRNFLSHTGSDGRSFTDRMTDAGYSAVGPRAENIGAGYASPVAAVNGWMASPDHCQNIMNAAFRALGAGYAYQAASTYGYYWTLKFGPN